MVNWLGATWLLQQQPLNLSLGGRLRLYYAELIGPVFHLKRWQIKRWGAWRVVFACLAFKHPKGLSFYHCLFKCIVTQRGHVFFSHYSLWRSLPSREIPLRFDPHNCNHMKIHSHGDTVAVKFLSVWAFFARTEQTKGKCCGKLLQQNLQMIVVVNCSYIIKFSWILCYLCLTSKFWLIV